MAGDPVAYTSSRLNSSTQLVVHRDKYVEFPFIYVKTYNNLRLAVVFDTGCGAQNAAEHDAKFAELKEFLDEVVLRESTNAGASEPHGFEYMVICTHCHFDHIGGIEEFATAGATIVASGYDKTFVSPENVPANSLCEAFGMKTPSYRISVLAEDGASLTHSGQPLGLRILHTPGHTPDSMAIYDEAERWLFSGDTCYRRVADMPWGERQDVPIVFPLQGNWHDFVASLRRLIDFVKTEESSGSGDAAARSRVKIACGHTTSDAIAADLLAGVLDFSGRVEAGAVPVMARMPGDQVAPGGTLGDAMFVYWQEDGEPDFSMVAPERFMEDFSHSTLANSAAPGI